MTSYEILAIVFAVMGIIVKLIIEIINAKK